MPEGITKRTRENGDVSYRWVANVGLNESGKRIRVSGTCPTEREAKAARRKALEKIESEGYTRPTKMILAVWLRLWMSHKLGLSDKSRHRYNEVIEKHLIPELGRHELEKLRKSQIEAYYRKALESGRRDGKGGLAPATVAYHSHVLSSALNDAVESDEVSLAKNPVAGCKLGDTSSPEMAALAAEEVRQLIAAAEGTAWETIVTLAVCTGCRRGELVGLKWRDVDFSLGTIRVLRSLSQVGKKLKFTPPKRHARRTIKLPSIAIQALHKQRDAQVARKKALGLGYQDNGLVCCQADGTQIKPDSLSHNFHRILKKAGVRRIRLHDMRHTHATTLLEQGSDLKTVQEDLGHRDGRTTMNFYAHVTPGMKQAAADSLDRAFGSAPKTEEPEATE